MDPVAEWMIETTTALERLAARLQAVEKTVDQLHPRVDNATAAAAASAAALTRIAKAEEDRLAFEKQVSLETKERANRERTERLQKEREEQERKDAWLTRVWSSQPLQLLLLGLVLVILNLLGLSYITERYAPSIVPVLPSGK